MRHRASSISISVVTDKSGKPIHGLVLKDFTLLDNHQPQKILSFHSFDEVSAKLDPPVEVILVVDTIKMPFTLAADERVEVEKFLRQSSGHLAQPISIFGISDSGLWKLAQPSSDGNALAAEIAEDKLMFIRRRLLEKKTGEYADSLSPGDPAGLSALKALGEIATSERRKPGRKVLIWIGPGWGVGSGTDFESLQPKESARAKQVTFDTIYWFSTLLREARISLFNFSVGGTVPLQLSYLDFLNGVQSVQQASLKNLDRRVLAVQSGGRVLDPTNDLVSQIDRCIQETSGFLYAVVRPFPCGSSWRVSQHRSASRRAGFDGPHQHRVLRSTLLFRSTKSCGQTRDGCAVGAGVGVVPR